MACLVAEVKTVLSDFLFILFYFLYLGRVRNSSNREKESVQEKSNKKSCQLKAFGFPHLNKVSKNKTQGGKRSQKNSTRDEAPLVTILFDPGFSKKEQPSPLTTLIIFHI